MGNFQWGHSQTQGAYWALTCPPQDADWGPLPRPPHITHDPLEGFPNGRKPRVMHATKEEMMSAQIPIADRDYCAHKLIAFLNCRKQKFPFVVRCQHERHELEACHYEDVVIRLKEAERERRLRERDAARAARAEIGAN